MLYLLWILVSVSTSNTFLLPHSPRPGKHHSVISSVLEITSAHLATGQVEIQKLVSKNSVKAASLECRPEAARRDGSGAGPGHE